MNPTSIGKFLADERKKKGYTQKQLANILIVSDKTISKWETGKSLPDIQMMNLLCQTLDISINELLLGEKISTPELESKSEENISGLLEQEHNKKVTQLRISLGLLILILCLLLFGICLWGTNFTKFIWYIDLPSLMAVIGILTALQLLSKKSKTDKNSFVERCIVPVGVVISMFNIITMLNSTPNNYILKNLGVCILPTLYSFILYIVLQYLKNRKKHI